MRCSLFVDLWLCLEEPGGYISWIILEVDDFFFVPNIGVGPKNPILINSVMTFLVIPGPLDSICHWTICTTVISQFHKISNYQRGVLVLHVEHIFIYFNSHHVLSYGGERKK